MSCYGVIFCYYGCEQQGISACRDVEAAGVGRMVRLSQGPCAQWQPPRQPSVVVTNPPWGARLADGGAGGSGGEAAGLESAWQELGLFLKVRCMHCAFWRDTLYRYCKLPMLKRKGRLQSALGGFHIFIEATYAFSESCWSVSW